MELLIYQGQVFGTQFGKRDERAAGKFHPDCGEYAFELGEVLVAFNGHDVLSSARVAVGDEKWQGRVNWEKGLDAFLHLVY